MSRRIDIELTSAREDGSWTWRAAGAKQPKGALDGSLLPEGAAVGDELRADVETTLDGTDVLSVAPPKTKKRAPAETIEILTKGLKDEDLVITTLAKRGRGDRRDRGDRGDRGPRREGDRRPRRDGDKPGGPRGERGDRRERPEGRDRPDRPRRDRPAPPAKPKAKRLRPGRTHRKAALDALAPEEQVIAEQVLRGGVPAVRQAVDRMNEQAKAEGRPEIKPDALVAAAERLLPALRAAEWRDRAEAAVADLAELDLRDLRSVVVAAEGGATKDDESRALAATLREGLSQRVDQEQSSWLSELSETLSEGRVVRALRLSSRPPKAGAPLPAELATRLADAASGALTADTVPDRWATVLDALSYSPVRLTVTPASKPETPNEELVAVVTRIAGRVPKVAEAFGIEAPAESPRKRGRPGGRKPKSGGPKGGRPKADGPKPSGGRPPKPPKPPAPEAGTASTETALSDAAQAPDTAPAPASTETASSDAVQAPVAADTTTATEQAPPSAPAADETPGASATDPAEAPVPADAGENTASSPEEPPAPPTAEAEPAPTEVADAPDAAATPPEAPEAPTTED